MGELFRPPDRPGVPFLYSGGRTGGGGGGGDRFRRDRWQLCRNPLGETFSYFRRASFSVPHIRTWPTDAAELVIRLENERVEFHSDVTQALVRVTRG